MGTNFTDLAVTDYVTAANINDRLDQLDAAALGGASASNQVLKEWAEAEAYEMTAVTWDSDFVVSSATVVWPDGSAGTFTRTTKNSTWLAIDAYTVSHANSSKTITQAAVTRNSDGNVTVKPALTVS